MKNSLARFQFRFSACLFLLLNVFAFSAEPSGVQLFDTGAASANAVSAAAFAHREQWKLLPEDETKHQFKGDAVLANDKLAIVFRQQGRGAEVYALSARGAVQRVELIASGQVPSASFQSIKILENNPGTVSLDATFKSAKGESLVVGYELKLGQVFVQTEPRSGATSLRVAAPCRFAVLPDFFADDMVVDAATLSASEAELPGENFLMHMLGEGEAIAMAVWQPAGNDVRIRLAGEGQTRSIVNSEIPYVPGGKISLALLDQPGIWHRRDIARADADQILHLNWQAPFTAHWRVDWRRDDQLTDSWEMLTQNDSGEYVKHGWYGQPESFGNVDWLKDGRKRWTTVLGSFLYPCWVDKAGEGYLQPLKTQPKKKRAAFEGPALIYPINRLAETPLEAFTIVDIMRATLGVGPCEYILDVEGQKKTYQGRPTCASRTILNDIYGSKQQKQKHAEVLQTLDEVLAFVRHIRGRIETYVAFGRTLDAFLEEQKKTHGAIVPSITDLQTTIRRIDGYLADRKEGIKTPEFAAQLVADFRANLVDYEGDDASAKCKQTTAALVGIGGNQDELVGECRMVVKQLRQQAALMMANDPRAAGLAKEVRRRTQEMLRNPTSYEAPRH